MNRRPGALREEHFWSIARLFAADAAERIFGPDPGLLRLRTAARTVLSAAIVLTVMLLVFGASGSDVAAIALGFMTTIFASMSVRDPRPAAQAMTIVLLAVPALAAVALASFLSRWPWAADIGFVALVGAASLARLAGPRGTAVGMVAFIAYFIGVIIRPPLTGMPVLAIAVGIGLGSVLLARFLLLPDDARATLRHCKYDLERRVARILSELEDALGPAAARAPPTDERRRQRLHREVSRLNDAVLIAHDQVESLHGEGEAAGPLRNAVLAAELATERLVHIAMRERSAPGRADMRQRIASLRHALRAGEAVHNADIPNPERGELKPTAGTALADLQSAFGELHKQWFAQDLAASGNAAGMPQPPPQVVATPSEPGRWWDMPPVRQAVQAIIAVGIAIAFGTLTSAQRWYWAVIAAFIVGTGVGSRGEALVKGIQRLAGTIVGIGVGIVLAWAVSGRTNLALALVLVCVFFAFYAFQAAYGTMMFVITLMVALLYGMLGLFSPGLLVLRLEETALGAGIAIAVTMLVLPIRQADVFRTAADDFLDALANAINPARHAPSAAGDDVVLEMQSKLQSLRDAVGSFKRGWMPLVPLRYIRAVRAARWCSYLARELVRAGALNGDQAAAIRREIDAIRAKFDSPAASGSERSAGRAIAEPSGSDAQEQGLPDALIAALRRLDERLQEAR